MILLSDSNSEAAAMKSNDELTRRSAPSSNLRNYTAAVGAAKVRARHLQPSSANFEFADDTYCPVYALRVPPRLPAYISTLIPICAIRRAPFPYTFTLPSGRYCLLRPRFIHTEANNTIIPLLTGFRGEHSVTPLPTAVPALDGHNRSRSRLREFDPGTQPPYIVYYIPFFRFIPVLFSSLLHNCSRG